MDRKLGIDEEFWRRLGLCAIVNITLIAKVNGHLPVEAFRQALSATCKAYPLLGVCFEVTRGGPRFVPVGEDGPLPLRTTERTSESQWMSEAEREHNTSFLPDRGPLFRAVLLSGASASEIILTIHHGIADLCAVYIMEDLLSSCGRVLEGQSPAFSAETLPDPVESRVPRRYRRLSGVGLLRVLRRRWRARSAVFKQLSRSEPDCPMAERTNHFVLQSLSPDETRGLIEACRSHRVSFYGATATAFLIAMGRHLRLREGEMMALSNAVSLRSYLEPPLGERVCCCAVGAITTSHGAPDASRFWRLAAEARAAVSEAIDRGELFFPAYPLRRWFLLWARSRERFAHTLSRNTRTAGVLSSLGALRISTDYGSMRLRSLVILGPPHVCKGLFLIAYTLGGIACFTFMYARPLIDPALAEEVAQGTLAVLREHAALP
ncbi:MAG: hypothetical protein AB1640_26030 [bacterium]